MKVEENGEGNKEESPSGAKTGSDLIQKAIEAIASLKSTIDHQVDELSNEFPDTISTQNSLATQPIAESKTKLLPKKRKRSVTSTSFNQDLSTPEGLGKYLKAWRQKERLSQTEVAAAIDATQSWYSMLEAGQIPSPDRTRLANLARLYNQDPRRFFSGSSYKDVFRWRPATKPRAGFCPNMDCIGLRISRTRFFRKGILRPRCFSQTIFKPRTNCSICNTTLVVRCLDCSFPIQRRGERYCSDCQAFHFAKLAKEIVNLKRQSLPPDSDIESAAVLQIEFLRPPKKPR